MTNRNDNTMEPGYLFPKGEIQGLLPHGDAFEVKCHTNDGASFTGILAKKYLHSNMTLTTGKKVTNLVSLGIANGKMRVACANYFNVLRNAIYTEQGKSRRRMPRWEESWRRDCSAEKYHSAFHITGQPSCKYGILSWQKWFEVRGSSFILPVRASRCLDSMSGSPLYCPLSAYRDDEKRTVYKMDEPKTGPTIWKVTARSGSDKSRVQKNMHFYLHGFVSPRKWHHGVWKHLYGSAPSAYPDDGPETWCQWTGQKIISPEKDTFQNCKENRKRTSCDESICHKLDLFPQVHLEIRALCEKYYQEIVTFFTKSTSKYMYIYDELNPDHKCVEAKFTFDTTGTAMGHAFAKVQMTDNSSDLKAKMLLRGACYDWEGCSSPTIHMNPVTLFVGKSVDTCYNPKHKQNRKPPVKWEIVKIHKVIEDG